MRIDPARIGCFVGVVAALALSPRALACDAALDGDGVPLIQCIEQFYDPAFYKWLAFRNKCNGKLKVTFIGNVPGSTVDSGDLLPGKSFSSGLSRAKVDKLGGLQLAVCAEGYRPVKLDGSDWRQAAAPHTCKLNGPLTCSVLGGVRLCCAKWASHMTADGLKLKTMVEGDSHEQLSNRIKGDQQKCKEDPSSSLCRVEYGPAHCKGDPEPQPPKKGPVDLQIESTVPTGSTALVRWHAADTLRCDVAPVDFTLELLSHPVTGREAVRVSWSNRTTQKLHVTLKLVLRAGSGPEDFSDVVMQGDPGAKAAAYVSLEQPLGKQILSWGVVDARLTDMIAAGKAQWTQMGFGPFTQQCSSMRRPLNRSPIP